MCLSCCISEDLIYQTPPPKKNKGYLHFNTLKENMLFINNEKNE